MTLLVKGVPVEASREDLIVDYIDVLNEVGIELDKEDGSTAPFTSLFMEEVCLVSSV